MLTRRAMLAIASLLSVSTSVAAQTPPPMAPSPKISSDQKMFVVTYIDVMPTKTDAAAKIVKTYATSAAKATGITRIDALQRIGIPNQFVLVEAWTAYKHEQANEAGAAYKAFRSAIAPLMIASYDQREHIDLNSGAAGKPAADAIFVVTHVDIIPTFKAKGVDAVKLLADKSRGTTGNVRFDALTQFSRQNHMSLVEVWKSRKDQENHTVAKDTKAFREALATMSGSLFDERLYRAVK